VAEGGGLLNRYRGSTSIVSSNLIPSANIKIKLGNYQSDSARAVLVHDGQLEDVTPFVTPLARFCRSGCFGPEWNGRRRQRTKQSRVAAVAPHGTIATEVPGVDFGCRHLCVPEVLRESVDTIWIVNQRCHGEGVPQVVEPI
jgi:hypothetical protein